MDTQRNFHPFSTEQGSLPLRTGSESVISPKNQLGNHAHLGSGLGGVKLLWLTRTTIKAKIDVYVQCSYSKLVRNVSAVHSKHKKQHKSCLSTSVGPLRPEPPPRSPWLKRGICSCKPTAVLLRYEHTGSNSITTVAVGWDRNSPHLKFTV